MINGILLHFHKHTVESEAFTSLDELPEEVKAIIDVEDKQNLYIQRNNTPLILIFHAELKEQGVIFTDILTAAREHGELVQKYFMKEGVKVDEHRLTALHAALVNGGAFLICSEKCRNQRANSSGISYMIMRIANLFNHVLIVAEDNSSVTYVENYFSTVETNRSCC